MSNIQAARDALLAELKHVEAGVAFYVARAESLRKALEQLDKLEGPATKTAGPAKAKKTKASRAARAANVLGELPRTRGDYWLQFIDDMPKTAAEIIQAALDSLTFTPSPDQVRKMRQRGGPALAALLLKKKITDRGAGLSRRYSLTAAKPTQDQTSAVPGKVSRANSSASTPLH